MKVSANMGEYILTRIVFIPHRRDLPSYYQGGDITEKFRAFGIPRDLKLPGVAWGGYCVQEWRKGILIITRQIMYAEIGGTSNDEQV